MTQAYPLQWPGGQPRTQRRTDSIFKVKASQAFDEMMLELSRFGASNVVVSTNIPLRQDGTPYRDGLTDLLADPGVAIYFMKRKQRIGIGVDAYRRPWENIRAIGLAVKAFRDIERHGAQQVLDQAFTGFTALPPPDQMSDISATPKNWWDVLGVAPDAPLPVAEAAWKALCRTNAGGTFELNAAIETARKARA